jgi:hypothetical protein
MSNTAVLAVILGLLLGGVVAYFLFQRRRFVAPAVALAIFQQQREHLEVDFYLAAARSGKPRGLRWKKCEWDRDVHLARDNRNGELAGFVGVTVQFEAVEGSDMEGLPAVGNLRHATGVFFFRGGKWRTAGRAVFNLNAVETIEHFKHQYEPVDRS